MDPGVPRRVLLVDDDGVTRSVLAKLLGVRGFEVIEAESGGTALKALSQPNAPRMAVVDWNMGTINGPELCRILRGRSPYTYVVLTTARDGRKPLVEAMNSGADGYIQKPVDPDELEAWLVAGQRIVDLQDRLLKAHGELEQRATHDALTGIKNRASLLEILGRELRRTRRTGLPTGVALFDVDHFKNVNDNHGHQAGDQVLIEVAQRCQAVVRDYDVFGRYGGEEFMVVLPGATTSHAAAIADRLLKAIARKPVPTAAGVLAITASAGVAATDLGYLEQEALLGAADGALYQAKRDGRACVRSAQPLAPKADADFPASEPDTMKASN
ncbi:MAG TPA: diguanylate cyclase [Polyangiaceae bacterium]|nr:diguanylate cyclase [Polyangiaceae bacterium]